MSDEKQDLRFKKGQIAPFFILFMFKNVLLIALVGLCVISVSGYADTVTKGYYPIEDTSINGYGAYQNTNYGTAQQLIFQTSATSGTAFHMFKFNMTKIRAEFLADWDSCNVSDATASFYITNVYPASEGTLNWTTQHYTNQTWVETVPKWNNWDSAGNFINKTPFVNQTIEGNTFVKQPSLDTRQTIKVTDGFYIDFNNSVANTSFILRGFPDNQANNNETDIATKENADSSKIPYVNVTAICLNVEEPTTTVETTTTAETTTTEETTTTTTITVYNCTLPTNVTGACCQTADYLYTQEFYGYNGTFINRNETIFCANGCSQVLNICNLAPIYTWLLVLLVVAIIIYLIKRAGLI